MQDPKTSLNTTSAFSYRAEIWVYNQCGIEKVQDNKYCCTAQAELWTCEVPGCREPRIEDHENNGKKIFTQENRCATSEQELLVEPMANRDEFGLPYQCVSEDGRVAREHWNCWCARKEPK